MADKRVATPFGADPRMCANRYLALLEMKLKLKLKLKLVLLLGSVDTESVAAVQGAEGGETGEMMPFTMKPVALPMWLRVRAAG